MNEAKGFSLPFSSVSKILDKNKLAYLNACDEESDVRRKNLNHVIGNSAVLAASESDEFFEAFIEWLRNFRNEVNK